MKYRCQGCEREIDGDDPGVRIVPGERGGKLAHSRCVRGPFNSTLAVECGPLEDIKAA